MIGYRYFQAGEVLWRLHMGAIIPLSMPHKYVDMPAREAVKILKNMDAMFIRWESEFDSKSEYPWWYIIKSDREDINNLPKKTRYQIRKGLEKYSIRKVGKSVIKRVCYGVYKETFEQYQTIELIETEARFKENVDALPDFTEFWLVEDSNGEVVGFSECLILDNAVFYVSIWILPFALKGFAGYALFHEMNKYYLNEIGLEYVSDGARSISHNTKVHEFLESKFNFRKAYSKLNIAYRPYFGLIVKLLFPFRCVIGRLPGNFFKKIDIVLYQEEIHRACQISEDF